MTRPEHIAYLLYKDLEGSLSETEAGELREWREEHPEHAQFFDELQDETALAALLQEEHPERLQQIESAVYEKIDIRMAFKAIPFYRRSFFRVAVAACITALILLGGYFMFFNKPDEPVPTIAKSNDVEAPKMDKAVITLSDGKQILVDTLSTYSDGNITITRTEDGRLVYAAPSGSPQGGEIMQTLSNPRGSRVIDMTLSDGSRVWLNAGSSISYPNAFMGNHRRIELSGEVYVKVTKNPGQPFVASANGMEVLALGTEFNIKSYEDEGNIKATLVEGSVKVNGQITLRPGEQSELINGIPSGAKPVNLEEVVGWKEGFFHFESADLKTIFREFARWYDIEVVYEGMVTQDRFFVIMNRNSSLATVLKSLKAGGVEFVIEGKKLVVKSG